MIAWILEKITGFLVGCLSDKSDIYKIILNVWKRPNCYLRHQALCFLHLSDVSQRSRLAQSGEGAAPPFVVGFSLSACTSGQYAGKALRHILLTSGVINNTNTPPIRH